MALSTTAFSAATALVGAAGVQVRSLVRAAASLEGALPTFAGLLAPAASQASNARLAAALVDLAADRVPIPSLEIVDGAVLGSRAGAWVATGNRLLINGDWLMGLPQAERGWRLQWLLLNAVGASLELRLRESSSPASSTSQAGQRLAAGLLGLPVPAQPASVAVTSLTLGSSSLSVLSIEASQVPPAPKAPEQFLLPAADAAQLVKGAQADWNKALREATVFLAALPSRADRDAILADVFGRAGTEAGLFEARKQALLATLGGAGLRLTVDLRSDAEMQGASAAYAAVAHNGGEIIYLNADKVNSGQFDAATIASWLLEEAGHAIDRRLNGASDSRGDEGQLFAALVSGASLTAEDRALIEAEDDSATLSIDGVQVSVEEANFAATTATNDNWTGDATNETLTVTNTNQIQAGDRFDGGGGTDRILISSATGVTVNFTAAGTTASTGFLNMEAIQFNNTSGSSVATFNHEQFFNGRINLQALTGTTGGTQTLKIIFDSAQTPLSLNLSSIQTFTDWTSGTDAIEIYGPSTAATAITITGSSVDDRILPVLTSGTVTVAASAGIQMTGGGGADRFYLPTKSAAATVSGAASTNNGSLTGLYTITDFQSSVNPGSGDSILSFTSTATAGTLPNTFSISSGASPNVWANGTASTLFHSSSQTIKAYRLSNGLLEFSTNTVAQGAAAVALTTAGDVAAAAQFITNSRTAIEAAANGTEGTFYYFKAVLSDGPHTYVLIQGSNGAAGVGIGSAYDSILIDLAGVDGVPNVPGQGANAGFLYIQDQLAPSSMRSPSPALLAFRMAL